MKKINLNIPSPCHENWEGMSPAEKGRFCASCRKTVVDFTSMSDRQLAEFFKKTSGSVCGRFFNDQLNRTIELPKKRIPWVRYFFQFTWPAFVLTLKSCVSPSEKPKTVQADKKPSVALPKDPQDRLTLGMIATQYSSKDTLVPPPFKPEMKPPALMGDIEVVPTVDTIKALPAEEPEDTASLQSPVVVKNVRDTAYPSQFGLSGTVGEVVVTKCFKKRPAIPVINKPMAAVPLIRLYPNPAPAGSNIVIKLNNPLEGRLQLLTIAGQMLSSQNITTGKTLQLSYRLPDAVPGTYLILITDATGRSFSEKIIIQ